MKRSTLMFRLWANGLLSVAGGLLLACGGCATPGNQPGGGLQMPGAPVTPSMPGSGSISPMPGYSASAPAAMPTSMPGPQPVAQVGYFHPQTGSSIGNCGCNHCGRSHGGTVPHGYAMPSPTARMTQGIDPQEFICDGGDQNPRAILRRNDTVAGVQPEDTVVHYTTDSGKVEFQASNRTCLYAPRFASVRKITGAVSGGRAVGLAQMDRPQGANRLENRLPGLVVSDTTELGHADVARRIDAMREQIRGVPVEGILQLEQAGDVMAALAGLSISELRQLQDEEKAVLEQFSVAAVQWELDESLEVAVKDVKPPTLTRDEHLQGLTIYEFSGAGRLEIFKLADRTDAKPGEIVRFSIRVENVGDSAVEDVVMIDNLTTRLEYVEDSQSSSSDAEFEAIANEAESLKLIWKLTEKLEVGDSVTIEFQCKVR